MFGRDIFIACDYKYCEEAETGELHAPSGNATFAELVKLARSEGWSVGRRHFCPTHRHMARQQDRSEIFND